MVKLPMLTILGNLLYASLILQFDGSLRCPIDLSRLASCAACIIVEPHEGDLCKLETIQIAGDKALLMLGGKVVLAHTTTTSGEVEYEGILFGLDKLHKYIKDNEQEFAETVSNIVVQGDCKNIIAQMNGLARPRRLEQHYKLCEKIVESLPEYKFTFQHIPREENWISDRLANRIILDQQTEAFNTLNCDLLILENRVQELGGRTGKNNELPNLINFLVRHIGVTKNSFLPFSHRIVVYRRLISISQIIRDYVSMLRIGELLQDEIKPAFKSGRKDFTFGGISSKGSQLDSIEASHTAALTDGIPLMVEALSYQLRALRWLGREKEAQLRYRKNRHVLVKDMDTVVDGLNLNSGYHSLDNKPLPLLLQAHCDQRRSENWLDEWMEVKLKTDLYLKRSKEFWYCTSNQ